VADTFPGACLAVVMTGMGHDGALGVKALKQKGCYSITQSEKSCVVYGMPNAVVKMQLSDEQVELADMAARITLLVRKK
jgi:two-component system, chemotaxis family, protein-glutamate methylesterase/glutaminase